MASDKKIEDAPRRTQIVSAATLMFIERGFAGTSVNEVATACGLQKASLYHHFRSKEELFVACVTDGYDQSVADLGEIIEDKKISATKKMSKAIPMLYDITIFRPVGQLSPVVAEVAVRFPHVSMTFRDSFVKRQHDLIMQIIDQGVAQAEFRDRNRHGLMHMIYGPIVTLSMTKQMFEHLEDFDEMWPMDLLMREHIGSILELVGARPAVGADA